MTLIEPYSPKYTPESLRERIIAPLRETLRELEKDLELFEKIYKEGNLPRGHIPLSGKLAERAVADLHSFQTAQLHKKLYGVLRGKDIYRDKAKKELKEKYDKQKRDKK